jgi:hypothetical protein
MADSIVGGLFGMTPEAYQQQQNQQALSQASQLAQLDPFALAKTGIGYGANRLVGALGGQDPQLRLISARNAVMQGIDLNDPEALQAASSRLAQIGDMQGAYGLSELAQKRAESTSAINLREAQAIKASMMPKLTGDERYIAQLRSVENTLRQGKTPSDDDLSTANIASQMLSKPRSFFDQASGQTVVIPATDPSKAFPLTFKQFGGTQEQAPAPTEGATTTPSTTATATRPSMPTTGTATVQQVTKGNLPAGVIQDVAGIDKQLKEIENRAPQLATFLSKIENGDVKYNLATNAYDIIGSIVPPIWGGKEIGKQIDKDEIQRALTARVNSVLNAAKGVQARDDAKRAEMQIASPSTFLSSERMAGAIKGLQKAEKSLEEELLAEKQTLQSKGQPSTPTTPPQSKAKSGELSRDEKINAFIRANNGKPTRQQAEEFLKSKGLLN